jgi:hypothetical protein
LRWHHSETFAIPTEPVRCLEGTVRLARPFAEPTAQGVRSETTATYEVAETDIRSISRNAARKVGITLGGAKAVEPLGQLAGHAHPAFGIVEKLIGAVKIDCSETITSDLSVTASSTRSVSYTRTVTVPEGEDRELVACLEYDEYELPVYFSHFDFLIASRDGRARGRRQLTFEPSADIAPRRFLNRFSPHPRNTSANVVRVQEQIALIKLYRPNGWFTVRLKEEMAAHPYIDPSVATIEAATGAMPTYDFDRPATLHEIVHSNRFRRAMSDYLL